MPTSAVLLPFTSPFDSEAPEFLANPYAKLREMREQTPVCIDPATGICFLLRFDDVQAGLTSIIRGHEHDSRRVHFPRNPFAADGPCHTGPRRSITSMFTNRAVQQFRNRAQEIVDGALAGEERGGELHVVDQLGFALPYHLTCAVLGVPDVDNRDELREWTWRSLELLDAFQTPEQAATSLEAAACLAEHLRDVIAWKRHHLDDDVLSMVIRTADAGEVMEPDQVVSFVHTLYLAGMHTTVNQTALSLLALLQHRDQWELLAAQPSLLDNAVDELLRYEPTAQYMRRKGDVDRRSAVSSSRLEPRSCWIASANRDELRWGASAEQLDITREDARHHVAFGNGPHVCVGSWLARLELSVVLTTIIGRYPRTVLPDQQLQWSSHLIRGPQELNLQLRT